MNNLPVREMVLYKHGVGFFVREGKLDGASATLTFRADEVNDVLKSLAVFDRAGGQVYGVHYQTPMDKAHRLANTSIRLSDTNSATQLIQQLRGRDATLFIEKSNGDEVTYKGRVVGIEQQKHDDGIRNFITIKLTDGMVRVFPFDSLRGISIQDEQSEQDLSYFLDTSMSEDNRRSVTVRLSEGEHDLVVNYVAPSPTWRVSYRLVAESDDDGETGTALLQGWGLFDNRLEEDLEDVKVTLVAGQPISFIYDLYESKIPERPLIKDEVRVVKAPVEYGSERMRGGGQMSHEPAQALALLDDQPAALRQRKSRILRDELESSTAVSTETKETGETFQYSVTTPVTVKRGESALVPILSHTVNYERELLYNKDKLPDHPVASLRYENQIGLTLERGPVTVVEDSDYKGEAIIPFTKDQNAVYVPYAVELGVTVKEESQRLRNYHGISINEQWTDQQVYVIFQTSYTIENSTNTDKVITIEAPINAEFDLFDTRGPDAITLNERRWKVSVPANETTVFVRKERHMEVLRRVIRNMKYHDLDRLLENQYIDNALIDDLHDILDAMQSINDMNTEISNREQEQKSLYEKQEEFRRNMKALGTTGKEGTLRLRAVDQLESGQDRLEAIDVEIADLKTQIKETEKQVDTMIAELGKKYPADETQTG
jgi:hypothetical protein